MLKRRRSLAGDWTCAAPPVRPRSCGGDACPPCRTRSRRGIDSQSWAAAARAAQSTSTRSVAGDDAPRPAGAGRDAAVHDADVRQPALAHARVGLGVGGRRRGVPRQGGLAHRRRCQGDHLHVRRDRVEQHGDQGRRKLVIQPIEEIDIKLCRSKGVFFHVDGA